MLFYKTHSHDVKVVSEESSLSMGGIEAKSSIFFSSEALRPVLSS